ncbi:MAG: prolipoprotein diacylglyceryl transferase [Proteobacteria bacterium]|nr:prolipoprotein diacylglyceryl transferase [Pseudomonadota bacterium]
MYPTLLGEGIWALPSYFTMVMLGFFVCALLFRREADRVGWDPVRAIDLMFVLVCASIVGARLAHILFDGFFMDYVWLCLDPSKLAEKLPDGTACVSSEQCLAAQNTGHDIGALCVEGSCLPEKDCFRALKFWSGGLTYYGGLILSLLSAWVFARKVKWPFIRLVDLASPLIALGLVFGRMGCFLAGCCFGKVTDVPWAVRFPIYSDAWQRHVELYKADVLAQHAQTGVWESLPVHPTQLYELFGSLAIAAFLWFYRRKRIRYEGQATATFLIAYGLLRFVIEIWRDDDRGGYWLSTSQWISLPLIVLGIGLIIHGRKYIKNASESA